jgi:hypothetical protein
MADEVDNLGPCPNCCGTWCLGPWFNASDRTCPGLCPTTLDNSICPLCVKAEVTITAITPGYESILAGIPNPFHLYFEGAGDNLAGGCDGNYPNPIPGAGPIDPSGVGQRFEYWGLAVGTGYGPGCSCDGTKTGFCAGWHNGTTSSVHFQLNDGACGTSTPNAGAYVSHTCSPFEINYSGGWIYWLGHSPYFVQKIGEFSVKFTLVDCAEIPVYRWWCVGGECIQSETMPEGATAGPWVTKTECDEECAGVTTDPYWCVDGSCVQAATSPPGATGGPFTTMALCNADCVMPDPVLKYWCIYGVCQSGYTIPHPDATGPFDLPGECSAECGPAEMVWICGPDSGPSRISKWEATQLGYTYYATEAEAEAVCPSAFWCIPEGCIQWWGGTTPTGATGGPYPSAPECAAVCDPMDGPGYYCVEGVCGFYSSRPGGATGIKHATFAACMDGCVVLSGAPAQVDGAPVQIQSAPVPPPPPPPAPRKTLKVIPPCFNRSEVPIDRAACNCPDKWVFSCKVFGKCRLRKDLGDGIAVCDGCQSWEEV